MTEYVVEVEGPTFDSQVLMPARILNTVSTLLDNQVYTFRVVASNDVGNDSTTIGQICKYTKQVCMTVLSFIKGTRSINICLLIAQTPQMSKL